MSMLAALGRPALGSRLSPIRAALPLTRVRVRWHGDHYHGPGSFSDRDTGLSAHAEWDSRDWGNRAFTVGIGGPVGSGKTALTLQLCRAMRDKYSVRQRTSATSCTRISHAQLRALPRVSSAS
jgi:hypothetical protein